MFNVHQGIAYYILATNVKKSSARRVIWKDIVLQSMKAKHITKTIFKRRNQTSHNPVLIFEIGTYTIYEQYKCVHHVLQNVVYIQNAV